MFLSAKRALARPRRRTRLPGSKSGPPHSWRL